MWDGALGTTEAYSKVPAPSGVSFLTKEVKNKKRRKNDQTGTQAILTGEITC